MREELVTANKKELPEGWKVKALSELITIRKGKKQEPVFEEKVSGSIPHILVESFDGIYKKYTTNTKGEMCNKDDILMIWDGSRYGLIATNLEGYVGSTLGIISSKGEILTDFLFYFLKLKYNKIRERKKGSGIPHLDVKYLQSLKVIFPTNLNEQQKIVDKLDKQMAQIGMMKRLAEEEMNAIENTFQSHLKEIYSHITQRKILKSLCLKTEKRTPQKEPDEFFDYIDIGSVDNKIKQIKNVKSILGRNAPSRARNVVLQDDIVLATTRPNLNAVALVSKDLNNQIASTGFSVLRCSKELSPMYLFYYIQSMEFITGLSDLVNGALYPAVTDKQVFEQDIPFIALNQQKEIVKKLDIIFEAINSLKKNLQKQLNAINQLPESLLNEVFGQYQLPDET